MLQTAPRLVTGYRAKAFHAEIMRAVAWICGTEWNSFYAPTPDGRTLTLHSYIGLPPAWVEQVRRVPIAHDSCACGQAAWTHEVVVADLAEAAWGDLQALARRFGIASVWSIPLVENGQLIGVYGIHHREPRGHPSPEELAAVKRIAHRAVRMIRTTHVYFQKQADAWLDQVAAGISRGVTDPAALVQNIAGLQDHLKQLRLAGGVGTPAPRPPLLLDTDHGLIRGLLMALEVRDAETIAHCQRVTNLTSLLAARMGLDETLRQQLALGAALHDVGKIGIPDRILHKPGKLTPDEYRQLQEHPLTGFRMLQDLADHYPATLDVIRHHHERFDGRGYPDGLRGEEIPFGARLFSVVDAFDAMLHDRPYRQARSLEEARQELIRERGRQFCPTCVDAFLAIPPEEFHRAGVERSGPGDRGPATSPGR